VKGFEYICALVTDGKFLTPCCASDKRIWCILL